MHNRRLGIQHWANIVMASQYDHEGGCACSRNHLDQAVHVFFIQEGCADSELRIIDLLRSWLAASRSFKVQFRAFHKQFFQAVDADIEALAQALPSSIRVHAVPRTPEGTMS